MLWSTQASMRAAIGTSQAACTPGPPFLATRLSPAIFSNMASTANQQQPFPAIPPSLSAGDYEMRDYRASEDAPQPPLNQPPYLTPYLGLRARLSQIWINRWTILLLLVLVRLLFAIASTNSSLDSARREAMSACTQVENIGSSLASMPHFMSRGVNEMTASGIEKVVHGLMKTLDLSVQAVEAIVLFVIHMLTSTYLCLLQLAVQSSVEVAVKIGEEITKGLNKTIDEVTNGIGDAANSFTKFSNDVGSKLKGIGITLPNIDLSTQITSLKALEAPVATNQGLQKLKDSVPSFDEIQKFLDDLIKTPFEEVRKLIARYDTYEFNRTLLPVPQKERLNFCSEGNAINNFFDDLVEMGITARKIALGVLIVLAVLACIPMAVTEVRRYRKMKERSMLFPTRDAMDVVYLASRPHSSSWGLWLGQRFGSGRRQIAARWAFAYATSVPMLFLLSLGVAGLFSCLCQYFVLRGIQAKAPELTNQVAGFADKVVTSLNNASMSWSGGVNGVMTRMEGDINKEMLGWVNTSTTAINDTLNIFVNKTDKALTDAFGGTFLENPVKQVLRCLIGLKVESFQKGLTFIHDKAQVSFPTVSNDTFSISALAQGSGSDSAADLFASPSSKATDEVSEAIERVIEKLLSGIRTEALISTVLICLWLLAAIGGAAYACIILARHKSVPQDPFVVNPALRDLDSNSPQVQAPYPDTAAPPYEYHSKSGAPQTASSRPFRTYGPNDVGPDSEQIRQVEAHPVVESARPGHLRTSSHGHLADPSPLDEKHNPFISPYDSKGNPFTDN